MKHTLFSIVFLLFASLITYSQQKATLVIIRDTGTVNWLTEYSAFHNGNFIGKLPNRSITKMDIEIGMHTFNFQFYGRKKPNPNRLNATFNAEAGKTYYVTATTKYNGFFFLPETLEVTENSAKQLSSNLRSHSVKM